MSQCPNMILYICQRNLKRELCSKNRVRTVPFYEWLKHERRRYKPSTNTNTPENNLELWLCSVFLKFRFWSYSDRILPIFVPSLITFISSKHRYLQIYFQALMWPILFLLSRHVKRFLFFNGRYTKAVPVQGGAQLPVKNFVKYPPGISHHSFFLNYY